MAWRDWIGDRIREARLTSGLTQSQLAAEISIYYQVLSKYESKKAFPSVDTVERIAESTGKALGWFFKSPQEGELDESSAREILRRVERAEKELAAARRALVSVVERNDDSAGKSLQ